MKETYFTHDTVDIEGKRLLAESGAAAVDLFTVFNPRKSALLILDMQEYFLDADSHASIPGGPVIIPQIKKIRGCFTQIGRPVIFTRHVNTDRDAGMMRLWWRDLIRRDNPFSELSEELRESESIVIEKCQYDGFLGTELYDTLKESDTEQIVITGVMTHLCCETTARSAFMQGFRVFFPVDATATYNRKFHVASCRNLGHGFAHIVRTKKLLEVIV